ncbi:MAG: hypothetical protein R3D71_10985 [Rickettsiales bacterium]
MNIIKYGFCTVFASSVLISGVAIAEEAKSSTADIYKNVSKMKFDKKAYVEHMVKAFEQMDANGDGELDFSEMVKGQQLQDQKASSMSYKDAFFSGEEIADDEEPGDFGHDDIVSKNSVVTSRGEGTLRSVAPINSDQIGN